MMPAIIEAWSDLLMQAIDDGNVLDAGSVDNVLDMRDCICSLQVVTKEAVELPIWVKEIVVGINQKDGCVGGIDGEHFGS